MMDWNRNPGPIRPVWRARGRTHDWVIVEAGGGTPNLLYSSPRRGSLNWTLPHLLDTKKSM